MLGTAEPSCVSNAVLANFGRCDSVGTKRIILFDRNKSIKGCCIPKSVDWGLWQILVAQQFCTVLVGLLHDTCLLGLT